jgi:HEAT repeat protein
MTSVIVHVYFVNVKSSDGPIPDIELRKLSEQTVAANVPLPAGKNVAFDFQAQLPEGLDPNGSYKIVATADIPGVKDPKGDAEFKVITPGHKRGGVVSVMSAVFGASEQELLGRYPGLLDDDEGEQFSALCELRGDTYGEHANKLVGLAPWLLRFAKTGPIDLRDEALETWAALLNNRARPSDIQELEAFAADPGLTTDLRRAVVTAATKFADEGAAPLLARLAKDNDPDVREQVARSLHYEADDGLPGRLELVIALTQDPDVSVRRSAAAALGAFSDNANAMKLAVELAGRDPSPDVRAEALESVAYAHYNGMLELVLATYEQHVKSPMIEVRKAIAGRVSTLPADPRVGSIVRALLSDQHADVRKKMAWYGVNMTDHPDLESLFRRVAEQDPDDEVRSEAVYGMRGFLSPRDAIAYTRQRLAADGTEKMCWTAINIARSFDDESDAKALLQDVTKCNYANAASSARDALREM